MGRQVSGIVLAPLDQLGLWCCRSKGRSASGIPVVISDSALRLGQDRQLRRDRDNRERRAHIAARRLEPVARRQRGKGDHVAATPVGVRQHGREREEGFPRSHAARSFPTIQLVSTGPTRRRDARFVQERRGKPLNRFRIQLWTRIFASNESTASGMLLALRDSGLAGKAEIHRLRCGRGAGSGPQGRGYPRIDRPGSLTRWAISR